MGRSDNPDADVNFSAKEDPHAKCRQHGFQIAVVALPDTMLFSHTDAMLDAGIYKRIMIEKPGCVNSEELLKLCEKGEERGVELYINY